MCDVLELRAGEEKGPRSKGHRDEPVADDDWFTRAIISCCMQPIIDICRQSVKDSMSPITRYRVTQATIWPRSQTLRQWSLR